MLQGLDVFLIVRGLNLNTVLKVRSPALSAERRSPPCSCWLHCFWYKLRSNWSSWLSEQTVGTCSAGCQLTLPYPSLPRTFPAALQTWGYWDQSAGTDTWSCWTSPIDLSLSIQPVQIPLLGLPTLRQINTSTQLDVICELSKGALNPLIQVINKDTKQYPVLTPDVHHLCLVASWIYLHLPPLSGPRPPATFLPSKGYACSSHGLLQENTQGDRVQGLTTDFCFSCYPTSEGLQVHEKLGGTEPGQLT